MKWRRGEEEKRRRGEEEKGRRGEGEKRRRGEEEKGRRGDGGKASLMVVLGSWEVLWSPPLRRFSTIRKVAWMGGFGRYHF
jgi:hypothetical protein